MTAEAGAPVGRPTGRHQGRDPDNLTRPVPASPRFDSTAELHNRLTEDLGRRPGSALAVAGIALALLLLVALVVTLWPPAA